MVTLIVLCARLAAAQDPESRFREALYHEVDKGDLDKALELYAKVEAEAGAPEPVRARAAFRRAWCLEKKGEKAQAESAYRSVTVRFPDQAETAARARERMDRLAGGVDRTAGPASQEDRIGELILTLGSEARGGAPAGLRSLVLIGDPAVPALRKALSHRDVTLSARSAQALVQMGQDEGTYDPLLRGLKDGKLRSDVGEITLLLKRNPEALKKFTGDFLKEEDPVVLDRLMEVPQSLEIPELRPRLGDLLVQGKGFTLNSLPKIAKALHLTREEDLLDLLARLEKSDQGAERAKAVFSAVSLPVTDTQSFCKHVIALYPKWGELDYSLIELRRFAPLHVLLRECGPTWLKTPTDRGSSIDELEPLLHQLGPERYAVISHFIRQDLRDKDATRLIGLLEDPPDAPSKLEARNALWWAAEHLGGRAKGKAVEALLPFIPETHPRWEELIGWAIRLRSESRERGLSGFEIFPSLLSRSGVYENVGAPGKKRIQTLAGKLVLEGAGIEQTMAVEYLAKIADESRFEVFSTMALEESRNEALRVSVLQAMQGADTPAPIRKRLAPLLRDRKAAIRLEALILIAQRRDGETDQLLLPMIEDPDPTVTSRALEYFILAPRRDFLEPFTRALKSKESVIRQTAAAALGRTESIQAVPELIGALEDEDLSVRQEVRKSLQQIKKRYDEVDEWKRWSETLKKKNP